MHRIPLVLAFLLLASLPAGAETLLFHASQSGKETLDQGEGGGNPFASSLIELLSRPKIGLSELPSEMTRLTVAKSRSFQTPDVPARIVGGGWSLLPAAGGEKRQALVMVVSDYGKSGGAQSLPGAKHDAERVSAALTKAGFGTRLLIDLDLADMRRVLAAFAADTRDAAAAVIYVTGHGVEVDGRIYLVPGDYPITERNTALAVRALPLAEIAKAPQAKGVNLVFYGGCRNDPLRQ